jgi:WD40 repeat protein
VWSEDDRYFAVIFDGGVQVWDLVGRKLVFTLAGAVQSTLFSRNGKHLACLRENQIALFVLPSGQEIANIPPGTVAAFHPRESWLASGAGRHVVVWDIEGNQTIKEFDAESEITRIHWSPDGRVVLCVQNDKDLYGTDILSGDKNVYTSHIVSPRNVTFSPDGSIFASSTHEGNTRLWDTLANGELTSTAAGAALRWSSDGRHIAFARPDGVGVWEVLRSPGAYSRLIGRMDFDLGNFATFSPNNRWIFSISDVVNGVWVWDIERRTLIEDSLLPDEKFYSIGFAGNRIVLAGAESLIACAVSFSGEAPTLVDRVALGPSGLNGFGQAPAVSTDGTKLFVKNHATEGRLLTAAGVDIGTPLQAGRDIASYAFHPSAEMIAVSLLGRGTELFSLPELRSIRRLEGLPAQVEFSPDGQWLANFTAVECEIWETAEWRKIRNMPRREADVDPGRMAFSPNSRWFAYIKSSHSCELLETGTWRQLAMFELPSGPGASRVMFSPNQEYLCLFGKAALHLYHLPSLRRELRNLDLDW